MSKSRLLPKRFPRSQKSPTTSQASNFLSAVDGLTPSNASVFQVLYSPVLYSPLIKKSTKKHPKNIENPWLLQLFNLKKQRLEVFDTSLGDTRRLLRSLGFTRFFSARQRPGSRVNYPESPGGDLLTFPNASSRDVFFHVNALDEKYFGYVGWSFLLMCCILFENTASHVSVRLGASVCLKSKNCKD